MMLNIYKGVVATSVLTGSMIFGMASANAGLIVDAVDRDGQKLAWGESLSWQHDITNNNTSGGDFTVGSDQVVSGTLAVELWDDSKSKWDWAEVALIQVQDFDRQDGGIFEVDYTDWVGDIGITAIASLNLDGLLDVNVTSILGDFMIGDSVLSVNVEQANVPEPASLALFGLGLVGLGLCRRKLQS